MYHRSGRDEQCGRKEQLLTEAAELFDEAAEKEKSHIEKSKQKKINNEQQRELAHQIRDDAMKTLRQKRPKSKKRGK